MRAIYEWSIGGGESIQLRRQGSRLYAEVVRRSPTGKVLPIREATTRQLVEKIARDNGKEVSVPNGVEVGQIWQDWEARIRHLPPRLLEVVSTNGERVQLRSLSTGRLADVQAKRMRPFSHGYKRRRDLESEPIPEALNGVSHSPAAPPEEGDLAEA